MDSEELLNIAVEAAENRKAEDIISLNINEISGMTNYFVVCHRNNERQVQSTVGSVKEIAHRHDTDVKRMKGYQEARWILIDLANVVVYVFHRNEGSYYNLEKLYQDTPIKECGQAVFWSWIGTKI